MSWQLVRRTQSRDAIALLLRAERPGPLILTGEPGIGRTTELTQALRLVDDSRDATIVVDVTPGRRPPHPGPVRVPAAADAIRHAVTAARAEGRRPVLVVDDAHLAGHAVVEQLRDLHRRDGVVLLMSRPADPAARKPDPLDCLRYEAGTRFLPVAPLDAGQTRAVVDGVLGGRVGEATATALHAATGGNPGLLHDLLVPGGLAANMVHGGGWWRLPGGLGWELRPCGRVRPRLLGALHEAWRAMSLDRLTELCRLALAMGDAEEAGPILAFALLLRGRAAEGGRLLTELRLSPSDENRSARLALTEAALLALGAARVDEAAALLAGAALRHTRAAARLLAARAWLLVVTGRTGPAAAALREIDPAGDAEAAVFAWAAAAGVEADRDRPKAAVSHLRRAIIAAEPLRVELPWLLPHLTGALIDALLLAGRINEATAAAADFHSAHQGCGWDVAVALSALMRSATAPADSDGIRSISQAPVAP